MMAARRSKTRTAARSLFQMSEHMSFPLFFFCLFLEDNQRTIWVHYNFSLRFAALAIISIEYDRTVLPIVIAEIHAGLMTGESG